MYLTYVCPDTQLQGLALWDDEAEEFQPVYGKQGYAMRCDFILIYDGLSTDFRLTLVHFDTQLLGRAVGAEGSELQYKCQLFPIFSIGNAERMENCPSNDFLLKKRSIILQFEVKPGSDDEGY